MTSDDLVAALSTAEPPVVMQGGFHDGAVGARWIVAAPLPFPDSSHARFPSIVVAVPIDSLNRCTSSPTT